MQGRQNNCRVPQLRLEEGGAPGPGNAFLCVLMKAASLRAVRCRVSVGIFGGVSDQLSVCLGRSCVGFEVDQPPSRCLAAKCPVAAWTLDILIQQLSQTVSWFGIERDVGLCCMCTAAAGWRGVH